MANATISDILQRGVGLTSKLGRAFIKDFSAAASKDAYKELRSKYMISSADWAKVPQNTKLIELVKAERDRRAAGKVTKVKAKTNKVSAASNIVELKPTRPIPIEDNDELVENLARFADGTLSESQVKARHHLDDKDWLTLGEDDALVRAIEARKLLRIRTGLTKKERAQNEIIDAPPILARIMRDPASNARHVVDSIKTLDALATGGGAAGSAPDASRFVITINLSADRSTGGEEHIRHYNKSLKPLAAGERDVLDPDDVGSTDVITMDKLEDDSGGQGHL